MFFIRRMQLRKNLEAPGFLRITVNGDRADTATKRTINPHQHISTKGCVKPVTQSGKELDQYRDQFAYAG